MGLQDGRDYVFCAKATYVGNLGVGEGCLVGTKGRLLMVPLKVQVVDWNRSVTTTQFSLGDEPLNVGLARVLSTAEMEVPSLESFMADVAAKVAGSALVELNSCKRVRVRDGWFSRGIYHSNRAKGPGWKGYPLKDKLVAQGWVNFYQSLPNFVA
ncbi:MAG: hypothetical protein ACI9KE_003750 [Polyangiales bacterium]|jgi:hypothetical protein